MLLYCAWTYSSPRCQYATGFTYFISANVTIFLLLFLNFYTKSYKKGKDQDSEIKEEYQKSRNYVKNNVFTANGKPECEKKENGKCKGDCKDVDEVPYEVNHACGDYIKNGKVFLSRRTANATFGAKVDFDSIIKK